MRKLLLIILCLSISSLSFATEGRMNGMGVNPIFCDDDVLFQIFPHYLSDYMNRAYIDAESSSDYSGGLNFKLFKKDVGIYINKDFPFQFSYAKNYQHAELEKAMNLYYSTGTMGFGFDIAMDKFKDDCYYGDNTVDENILGLGGKFGMKLDHMDLGGDIHYATGKSDNEYEEEEYKNSAMQIGGVMRMKKKVSNNCQTIPALEAFFQSMTEETTNKDTNAYWKSSKSTSSYFSIFPGIGMNYWLMDQVLAIGAISCGFCTGKWELKSTYNNSKDTTYTDESTYTEIILPKFELGLEAYLTKWLTCRAGINKKYYYHHVKESYCTKDNGDDDCTITSYDSDFDYHFGLGIKFKRFSIDWEICTDLLWNAPYIITGNSSEFGSSFTVQYDFD